MGVLELFGTLIKNDITSSAIRGNFTEKLLINHLFLDFNSIIHVSSQKIIVDVNVFLQMILKNLYANRAITNIIFTEKFEKYGMINVQKKINQNTEPEIVIKLFQEHFNEKYMDKLIITLVINSMLHIVRTYCQNKFIQTFLIAIDGVPSKGKMIEQKQRRYMGAVIEDYKNRILAKYKNYLLDQPDYIYIATKDSIKWSRNKITPGTAFMNKMVNYLRSDSILSKLKINRPNMEIIISDMYEVGEGEKKIVNYVNMYLPNTSDSVMIYSPDADVILLCMLLPVNKLYMLRFNDQETKKSGSSGIYDLIDIRLLKSNISFYINNNPNYSKEQFDINRINHDLVLISTLFGNDFVPKIETLNVKKGFQTIMDAYLKTLLAFKHKGYYLVKTNPETKEYRINFAFLKHIIRELLPEEDDFIKNNNLYTQYITIGQIKNVFDYVEITSQNLVPIFNQFRQEYENLKHTIKQNGNLNYFETHEQFMNSLKKAIIVVMDGQGVNTSYLPNKEVIKIIKKYYQKNNDFPRLNINLNMWSHSITDYIHKQAVKNANMNDYKKEVYQFENMLDQYYIKLNAQPLVLTKNKIGDYYSTYFGVKQLLNKNNTLTNEAAKVVSDYLQGMVWVFNYYFNDTSYVNRWYYSHERAPLLRHLAMYLDSINMEQFNDIYIDLKKFQVDNLDSYFNPVEQLIYVSPITPDIIKLLPLNYQKYLTSNNLDPFLKSYFVDIKSITSRLWQEKVSCDVDCHSIIYFNKCLVKSFDKPDSNTDKQFLRAIRKVKPTDVSERRSKSVAPAY